MGNVQASTGRVDWIGGGTFEFRKLCGYVPETALDQNRLPRPRFLGAGKFDFVSRIHDEGHPPQCSPDGKRAKPEGLDHPPL